LAEQAQLAIEPLRGRGVGDRQVDLLAKHDHLTRGRDRRTGFDAHGGGVDLAGDQAVDQTGAAGAKVFGLAGGDVRLIALQVSSREETTIEIPRARAPRVDPGRRASADAQRYELRRDWIVHAASDRRPQQELDETGVHALLLSGQ
jgi:hypothetical protein